MAQWPEPEESGLEEDNDAETDAETEQDAVAEVVVITGYVQF